jgi:hypothetical protein
LSMYQAQTRYVTRRLLAAQNFPEASIPSSQRKRLAISKVASDIVPDQGPNLFASCFVTEHCGHDFQRKAKIHEAGCNGPSKIMGCEMCDRDLLPPLDDHRRDVIRG